MESPYLDPKTNPTTLITQYPESRHEDAQWTQCIPLTLRLRLFGSLRKKSSLGFSTPNNASPILFSDERVTRILVEINTTKY